VRCATGVSAACPARHGASVFVFPPRRRWHLQGKHLTRRVDTIVLNPTIRDALLEDARAFDTKSALRWYTSHGLPYRRCYLFYGPPGTGKSSFIRALAGILKRSIAFFQCAHNKLNDQILADAFRDCPSQSILVLEGAWGGRLLGRRRRCARSGAEGGAWRYAGRLFATWQAHPLE